MHIFKFYSRSVWLLPKWNCQARAFSWAINKPRPVLVNVNVYGELQKKLKKKEEDLQR